MSCHRINRTCLDGEHFGGPIDPLSQFSSQGGYRRPATATMPQAELTYLLLQHDDAAQSAMTKWVGDGP